FFTRPSRAAPDPRLAGAPVRAVVRSWGELERPRKTGDKFAASRRGEAPRNVSSRFALAFGELADPLLQLGELAPQRIDVLLDRQVQPARDRLDAFAQLRLGLRQL